MTFSVTFSESKSTGSVKALTAITATYNVVVDNPCVTATMNAITPALSNITVNRGATITQESTKCGTTIRQTQLLK